MTQTNLGFLVIEDFQRPPDHVLKAFLDLDVANIGDAMNRVCIMSSGIRAVNTRIPHLVGPAFTVRTRAGDNLMVHKALDMAHPGDVVVIDAGGFTDRAILGEIMVTYALKRGIAGIILDGSIRDYDQIRQMPFPVFAKGVSPAGPYKDGPGEINVAICCGGIPVNPGDIVIGDGDGVIVVPREEASVALERVKKVLQAEEAMKRNVEAGTLNRAWIDAALREKGCSFRSS